MAKAAMMNPLDRLIGWLDPVSADARMQARQRLNLRMNYDAATMGSRASGWRGPSTSADAAAYGGARARMRNLARDFVRNRPYAQRGLTVITGNVVGTGVVPSVEATRDADASRLREIMDEHFGSPAIDAMGLHNLPGLQRVGMNSVVEDGEVLLRRRWRSGRWAAGLVLPFQVELLEADYLDTAVTSYGENRVFDGVEYGPTGRVEAYHLFPEHPGAMDWRLRRKSVRVPAADVIHVRRADRTGQTRGVTWFAPVMLTLGDMSDYQEAEIIKQKMAALLAGVLESDMPVSGDPGSPEAEANSAGLGELAPGTIVDVPAGKTINWTNPPQVQGYDKFMAQNLAAVAMGLGITYESLAGDLSRVNYSSARMGRIEMDRNVEIWQQQIMIDLMCRGIERWMREALSVVVGERFDAWKLHWTAPRRALIDPTREVGAILQKIEGGLTSLQREQRQLGLDPEVITREREEDIGRVSAPVSQDS